MEEVGDFWSSSFYDAKEMGFGLDSWPFESDLQCLLGEDELDPPVFAPQHPLSTGSTNQTEGEPSHQQQGEHGDDDVDEVEGKEAETVDKRSNGATSRNLVSERNRRKRLNQQILTLGSLVPNISKMEKRSILVEALAYLESILEETRRERERISLTADLSSSSSSENLTIITKDEAATATVQHQQHSHCASPPTITEIDVEMLDQERFVVKIWCNKAIGALGQVQRVIKSLGVEITSTYITEFNQHQMLITSFLLVKKKGNETEEKLKHRVKLNAKKLGIRLWDT